MENKNFNQANISPPKSLYSRLMGRNNLEWKVDPQNIYVAVTVVSEIISEFS